MKLIDTDNLWQAQNLPDGLFLKDGVILGNPKSRGTFDVPVTVSNSLGNSTKTIRIKCRYTDDVNIIQGGEELEIIRIPKLQASIQNGTAQSKYNCSNTQMLIPFTHPLTGEVFDIALNFCSFRNATLQDGTVKAGLILQFANPLWIGAVPFTTNNFNRWKYSQLRKWLNSRGDNWFTSSYNADVLSGSALYAQNGVKGFLSCIPDALYRALQPVKIVTQAFFDDFNDDTAIDDPDYIDGYDADITFDKIFLPSMSEMNAISSGNDDNFPTSSLEGTAWEFFSQPRSDTFNDWEGNTCSLISRSAYLDGTTDIIYVNSSRQAVTGNTALSNSAPAPAFFLLGGED